MYVEEDLTYGVSTGGLSYGLGNIAGGRRLGDDNGGNSSMPLRIRRGGFPRWRQLNATPAALSDVGGNPHLLPRLLPLASVTLLSD